MSAGQKDKGREFFHLLRVLPNKKNGFTLIEVLLVGFILSIVLTALILTLTIGDFSHSVDSAKIDLQANVRKTIEWIIKDVRQTTSGEVANNAPSTDHIKFRKVESVNTTTGYYILTSNYTEYNYDSNSDTISRNLISSDGTILQSWNFSDIKQSPFHTVDSDGLVVPLNQNDLLTSRKMIVKIISQKNVRASLPLNVRLSSEVKLRNE